MQDPSTQNPSDPEKSGSGSGNPPKKPLKLKPIGQPKRNPETSEIKDVPGSKAPEQKDPPEQEIPKEKPAPKAVPTDPPPTAESKLDERRKNLKMRRMVVKDVEINPHINPDTEPVPEAQPFEEPEEAPPPPDLKAVMEAPRTEEPPPAPPPPKNTPPEPEKAEKAPPPEAGQPEESGAQKVSPIRKIIAGLAFLGVFCLLILLGIAFFNPFGKDLAPIQPNRVPVVPQEASTSESGADGESVANLASVPGETSQPDLQVYLDRLQTHRVILSDSPKGIFVDSVFIPEGAVMNPRLGLTLTGISQNGEETSLVLTSAEGSPVSIPLERRK